MGATWRFAWPENRDAFAADPESYAPQYGGWCAWAVAHGYTAKIDPEAWSIVDGRLYLNYSKAVQLQWARAFPATSPRATPTGRSAAPTSPADPSVALRRKGRISLDIQPLEDRRPFFFVAAA